MNYNRQSSRYIAKYTFILAVSLWLWLAGCRSGSSGDSPTSTPLPIPLSAIPTLTPLPGPSPSGHLTALPPDLTTATNTRLAETRLVSTTTTHEPPAPTPLPCETHTAAMELSASATTLTVGDVVTITVTLRNQGCSPLGLPKYTLRSTLSLFDPATPEDVTHYLAVQPGQADTAEFRLRVIEAGQATLTAGASFEVHLGYPGPAYWAGSSAAPLVITVSPAITPTPQASPPITGTSPLTITQFTISPPLVRRGDPVTLTWQTTGAERVLLFRLDWRGRLAEPQGMALPPSGSLVMDMADPLNLTYHFHLIAQAGQTWTTAYAKAEIICETAWFFANPPPTCPQPARSGLMAAQRFEHGLMLWGQSLRTDGVDEIVILLDNGQWKIVRDLWQPHLPENDPTLSPPAGFYQPVRGFGRVWREEIIAPNQPVRAALGWALEPEYSLGTGFFQCDTQSYTTCYLSGPEEQIYVLPPEFSSWSIWGEVSAGPAFTDERPTTNDERTNLL